MNTAHFKRLDDEFESWITSLKQDVGKTELTPAKKRQRRKKADASDIDFCRIYFPQIFDASFNRLHQYIADLSEGKYYVSGFPQSGKTAFCFVGKGIKHIAQGRGGIFNISLRTMERAKERTYHILRLIKFNKKLMYDYDIDIQQELKGFYIINNTYMYASSFETGLRSVIDTEFNRITLSINDDLYDATTVSSENDNDKVTNFIIQEIHRNLEPEGSLSISLGNMLSETCPVAQLRDLDPDHYFNFPPVDSEGHSTWPKKFSDEYMRLKEKELPTHIWLGDWMGKPAEIGDVFQNDWLKMVNVNYHKIIATLSAIDPSYGESPSACAKGIATVSLTEKLDVILEDIYIRKENYTLVFDYISAVRKRYPKWKTLIFENDFNQWAFAAPYYIDWLKQRGKPIPIVKHLAKELKTDQFGADKDSRILNLVHPHQTRTFLYSDQLTGSKDYEKYLTQFYAFGRSKEKLDGLDATATAFIMIFRYIKQGNFKSLKNRLFKKDGWFTNPS